MNPAFPLAVAAPNVGGRSESFIARHMRDLLPGRTIVVSRSANGVARDWEASGPVLDLDRLWGGDTRLRVARGVASRFGFGLEEHAVQRFLARHRAEVLLGEYLDLSLRWWPVARRLGIRFFGHAHGIDVSARLRDPSWRTAYLQYNDAAGLITMSHASRKRLLDLGLRPEKVHVIPYGVDVPPAPPARPAREGLRCLTVGRMVPKKAPILLLDAFRRAAEATPGITLDYIGPGHLLPAARQYVQAMGLQGRVRLHGGQPNEAVRAAMREADVFLQHSVTDPETGDEEGLPVAILEAMAAGLPVVATRHAGIPEAVEDGATGFLVAEGDTEGMAKRLMELADDAGMRQRMGGAGWRKADKSFAWKQEQARLLEVIGLEQGGMNEWSRR